MSIRFYLITLVLTIMVIWGGVFWWTMYQANRAHTILSTQISELRPISQAARSLHQHWIDRSEAIDAQLSGYRSKEEARQHATSAKDGMQEDMKLLEKLLGAASDTALQTDLKPQKSLRDLKNSVAVSLQADDVIFSQASPSANDTDLKDYLTTLSQETSTVDRVTTELQTASAQSSNQAAAYIAHLTAWWWMILAGVLVMSTAITLIISRSIASGQMALTQQLQAALDLQAASDKQPEQPAEPGQRSLPELIQKLSGKIKSNNDILQQTITEKEEEVKKVKMGLEKIIEEQKRQYEEKITELSTLNKAMIGRELKMARLKQEIHELKEKTGTPS